MGMRDERERASGENRLQVKRSDIRGTTMSGRMVQRIISSRNKNKEHRHTAMQYTRNKL